MNEEWKSVVGFEEAYEVSNKGRVRSKTRLVGGNCGSLWKRKGKIRNVYTNKRGYKNVVLYFDGKMQRCSVHRLVAMAFLENPYNLPFINHKDENPSNNNVENLEWCTAQYNSVYGHASEKRVKHCCIPVAMCDNSWKVLKTFPSSSAAGREMSCDNSAILKCCKGLKKQVAKHKWKFI